MKVAEAAHILRIIIDWHHFATSYAVNTWYVSGEPTALDAALGATNASVCRRLAVQGGIALNGIPMEKIDHLFLPLSEGDFVLVGRRYGAMYIGDGKIVSFTIGRDKWGWKQYVRE